MQARECQIENYCQGGANGNQWVHAFIKADEIKDDYFSFDGSAHFNSYFNEFFLEIKILCIISGLFHHSFFNECFRLIEIAWFFAIIEPVDT